MGKDLLRALAISLLLHFLLLWPATAERRVEEPPAPLTATLRERPAALSAPAPVAAARPAPAAPAPSAAEKEEVRSRAAFVEPAALPAVAMAATNTAPLTADVLPRSENHSAPVAATTKASPTDGSAEGMRQYRLALAVEARRFKRYPPRALDAGIGGTAEIRIEIAEGRMRGVALARPSGDAALDAAALDMMRKAAPRTAVPETLRGREFAVSLPIVFDPADE